MGEPECLKVFLIFFSLDLCCVSLPQPEELCLGLDHPPPVLGVSCAHSCRENLGQLLLPAAQGGLLKVFARV